MKFGRASMRIKPSKIEVKFIPNIRKERANISLGNDILINSCLRGFYQ
jgi:hypothetical protein